jgi:hypothetical protein
MTNDEIQMTKQMPGVPERIDRQVFASSFVIRISSFIRGFEVPFFEFGPCPSGS